MIKLIPVAIVVSLAALLGWWAWPVKPADAPHFHWQPAPDDRYELVVSEMPANPAFRRGVETPPVPRSGPLRVSGGPGAAEAGAVVEVSNPRTRDARLATADGQGAFAVEVDARRGDTLRVLSRRIQFRQPSVLRASPAN